MIVECFKGSLNVLLSPVGGILVVLHDAHGREHPGAAGRENLVVCHAHPLDNLI